MREKWIRLWRDFRFPLMVAFGTMPVGLVLFSYYMPQMLPLVWAWPLGYLLLDALSTRIPGKWRIAYGFFEAALLVCSGWYVSRFTENRQVLILPGMYCVALLWGLALSAEDRNDRIGPLWYVLGIAVHLFAQLMQYSARILENPALDPVRPWNAVSFFAFAILCLITLNQANLKFSTGGRQNASRIMQRKNLLMVLGLFAIALLISSIPALINGAGKLLEWIVIAILWLITRFGSQESGGSAEGQGGDMGEMMLPGAEKVVNSPMWLKILLTVIVLALVAAVLGYAVYFFARKLVVFVKFLSRISGKYLHAISEDYVDEITDTREGRENLSKAKNRKTRLSALDERRLPPDQRIRYRFKRLLRKHPEWESGATAREKLPAEAAPIYERVRYSPHPVTEEDAQRFAAETKKV